MSLGDNIPEHWEWKKLDDVVNILDRHRDPIKKSVRKERVQGMDKSERVPYYGATGQAGWIDDYIFDKELVLLGEDGAPFSNPASGEVSYMIDGKSWVSNHAHVLEGKDRVMLNKYLCYVLRSVNYTEYVNGSTREKLTQTSMKKIKLPVPSLSEQEAIVDKLDEIFERIEEIQNAQEKIEKIYQDISFAFFTSRVRDADTKKLETGELINSTQYGSSNATNSDGNGYPSLRMGNYNLRGEMDYSKIKYQDLEGDDFEKYRVEKGDVLFNRTNSKDLVGKMCIYDGGLEDAVFASYLIRVELNEDRVLPEYFVTYMNSHLGEVERQGKLKQAVSQANINATELREMEMAVPSLERQKEIVKSLNYMRSKVDDIKSEVDKKGKLIEDMPNSILAEAFKGNLVDFGAMSESDELGSTEQGIDEKQESSSDGEGQQSLGEYR